MQGYRNRRLLGSLARPAFRLVPLVLGTTTLGCPPAAPRGTVDTDHGADPGTARPPDAASSGQEPYPEMPVGIASAVSAGVAIADLNGDGFPDIVVANGDDLQQGPIYVFLSDHGRFSHAPSWQSRDVGYYTGVALGDLNHDQRIDIAVSVGPDPCSGQSGGVKVYNGRGDGTFDSKGTPVSNETYFSVGCAIGDADGDGNLDLAVAVAEEQNQSPGRTRVYESPHGQLSATHVWRSQSASATGAKFADLDGDGVLDLVLAAPGLPAYRGILGAGGVAALNPLPESIAQQNIEYPMSVDVARTDGGTIVVASYNDFAANNTGCGDAGTADVDGTGRRVRSPHFRAKSPSAPRRWTGTADSTPPTCDPVPGISSTRFVAYRYGQKQPPLWTSESTGWGAGVALMQAGRQPGLDLVAARMGPSATGLSAPLQIYPHDGGTFSSVPSFTSATCSFQQYVAVADLRQRSLVETSETFQIDGSRAVLTLSTQVVNKIKEIRRNGALVDPKDYATIPGGNWISFRTHFQRGEVVVVTYNYSTNLDIVVTNADVDNAIYYNNSGP